ncbi:pH-response regulator protein palC [Aureobasidium pullulans]|uniref:pH-response regulator protein palC n=1 Tax=Aureobasidium pullulans TaxID=5580 RepID=A0A4S9E122_AURPU|nr:pH-response regulator protein palC [Aureobasidium pullulans]
MPYPFTLPTTSSTPLDAFISSPSHPSLPLTATTQRSVLRDALKKHKRLPPAQQAAHLGVVQEALNAYLPYALGITSALNSGRIGDEPVNVTNTKQLQTEWRLTLSATLPGREPPRAPLAGVYNDVAFVLQSLAYIQVQQARVQLQVLYSSSIPSPDRRTAAISSAMKYLLEANAIHNYILNLHTQDPASAPLDTVNSTQVALAALALAEATLITVLKDDPYTTAVIQARNKEDKEWMISAPSIPKVRAHLFARLCLCASDHAQRAAASLAPGIGSLDSALLNYVDDLRRTSRAKAARFLAIDAEIAGKTGEAIAYLRGARKELGLAPLEQDASKRKGWKGIKQTFAEKREDRKVEKGSDDWGLDAGKLEEARVLEWLEVKWVKMNDTINVQAIPPSEPLMATMPSGREYHTQKPYMPPQLDVSLLARLRAPVDPQQRAFGGDEDDSGDEGAAREPVVVPGAFPGAATAGGGNAYY